MRNVPSGLAVHLATGATTLCNCWKVSRRDGVVLGFTDHDEDLSFDGVLFRAGTGFEGSEVEARFGLAATGSELHGALSDDTISESDLASGKFDAARVELFLVDWTSPANRMLLRSGDIGEVRREGAAFAAEIRGLSHQLDQEHGRIYAASCDADLGDVRCAIGLSNPAYRAEASIAGIEGVSLFAVEGIGSFADEWFSRGRLVWASGANAGLGVEVKSHRLHGGVATLSLWQVPPHAVSVGDTFAVTAGCDKRFETCRDKFANAINFRGFPHLPGNDFVTSYAVPGEPGHDGSVLR